MRATIALWLREKLPTVRVHLMSRFPTVWRLATKVIQLEQPRSFIEVQRQPLQSSFVPILANEIDSETVFHRLFQSTKDEPTTDTVQALPAVFKPSKGYFCGFDAQRVRNCSRYKLCQSRRFIHK